MGNLGDDKERPAASRRRRVQTNDLTSFKLTLLKVKKWRVKEKTKTRKRKKLDRSILPPGDASSGQIIEPVAIAVVEENSISRSGGHIILTVNASRPYVILRPPDSLATEKLLQVKRVHQMPSGALPPAGRALFIFTF